MAAVFQLRRIGLPPSVDDAKNSYMYVFL